MHSFNRILIAILGVALFFSFISGLVIVPYMNSESSYFQDKNVRKTLAGTIDCLVIGDSHALAGINTEILDNELGYNSYNLSGSMMTLDNKYYLLSKELARNPVDTVVIDIGRDTLTRDETQEFAIGDEPTIARLDSFGERISYVVQYMPVNDWLNLYSREFVMGLEYYQSLLTGESVNNVDYNLKGYRPKTPADITLSEEEAKLKYNSSKLNTNYRNDNIEKLNRIIDLCNSYHCRIVLVVIPESNRLIWEIDGWDSFYEWLKDYANQKNCELYDINLVKNRNEIFKDSESFSDPDHVSTIGAEVTTRTLAQVMKNPKDWQLYSYQSYDDVKKTMKYEASLECVGKPNPRLCRESY